MCLSIGHPKPLIAKENIRVYKVFHSNFVSPYLKFQYDLDTIYKIDKLEVINSKIYEGFHAYCNNEYVRIGNIYPVFIPKGSEYFISIDGEEIVSNSITLKPLEPFITFKDLKEDILEQAPRIGNLPFGTKIGDKYLFSEDKVIGNIIKYTNDNNELVPTKEELQLILRNSLFLKLNGLTVYSDPYYVYKSGDSYAWRVGFSSSYSIVSWYGSLDDAVRLLPLYPINSTF